jgi:hypothetical protein
LADRVGPLLRRHGLPSGSRADDADRAVWPEGSLPPGAAVGEVDQAQLTLL